MNPVTLRPGLSEHSTVYGLMIDHLWSNPGQHTARRPHWPADLWLCVEPFTEAEIKAQGAWAMAFGVFIDDDMEYGSPPEDMAATDWLIGSV